jgi:hypothetical protein
MIRWGAGALAFALVAQAACVDTTPIDYVAPAAADGGAEAGDAGSRVQDDAGLVDACKACITQGACKTTYDACNQNAKCAANLGCDLDKYCLNYSTASVTDLPPCVFECSLGAGIVSQSDPSIDVFLPVLLCAQSTTGCGAVCNVGRSP